MPLAPNEIARGLVLHLDPDVLESEGSTYTCSREHRVRGRHHFLCIDVHGDESRWLPLFSKMMRGRQPLPPHSRAGDPWWVFGTFHFDPRQVWTTSVRAVAASARAANEFTTSRSRNRLAEPYVPVLPRESGAG